MSSIPKLCIHAKVTFAVVGALLGWGGYALGKRLRAYLASKAAAASTSSGAAAVIGRGRANPYETTELLHQYLSFHYGQGEDVGLTKFGPVEALDFARRVAAEALESAPAPVLGRALDVGCAVGGSSFELARGFREVIGLDFSASFIAACDHLKEFGQLSYSIQTEGQLTSELVARVDPTLDRSRCSFEVGDACTIRSDIGQFGLVLAANLICRLPRPTDFLVRCATLVAPGGLLVLTTPYTWLPEYTPPAEWLGGYVDDSGRPVAGFEGLSRVLSPSFELVREKDLPFFIRETSRKNQWTLAHLTVWRRK